MQIWTETAVEQKFQGGTLTIGNFDGLHIGHRALLAEAQRRPRPWVVLTFDPHPVQILHPEKALKRLFPKSDTATQLGLMGFDLFVVLRFSRELASLSADEFLLRHVLTPFHPSHFVVGHDFALGRGRQGHLSFLRDWSEKHGINFYSLQAIKEHGVVVSSGRIREALALGDVEAAARLLGRPFYLRGEIIAGDGRGRLLGFPTVNQTFENETVPATGVYVSILKTAGASHAAATNIGFNPTFGGATLKVESFLLSGRQENLGTHVELDLLQRLRPEMKFSDQESLKKQIESDILKAKAYHESRSL